MKFATEFIGLSVSKDLLTERVNESISRPKKMNRLKVDRNNYKTLIENDLNTYRNVVDDSSNQASLANLDKVVECVNHPLYCSAKLASNNTPNESDESVGEDGDEIDNEINKLGTVMLEDYNKSNCTLEEYENVRQQAV